MTADNQSYLRFSVEESVWFQKGQEVADLISISLYPDITIEEHDQYITIRGALKLNGEYRIDKTYENNEEESQFALNARVINDVIEKEDGISELKHSFPVDITIPRNRIQDIEDVYVSIDSFDYEIPGNRCLQVAADLSISGIYNNLQQQGHVFQTENQQRQDTDEENIQHHDLDRSDIYQVESEATDVAEIKAIEENDGSDVLDVDEDLYTPIEVEARREAYQENTSKLEEISHIEQENRQALPQIEFKGKNDGEYVSAIEHVDEEKANHHQAEKKNNVVEKQRDENALYLTKIFPDDGDQDFSKLKLYIVQDGDTIEAISERYDISIQSLQKVNGLDHDRGIHEGEILYITVPERNRLFS